MIEIGGKPVLQHNLELLARAGVSEAVVNLHHLPDVIRDYFGDGRSFGVPLTYLYEPELLGTAGAARNAAALLGDGAFLVVYGDNLSTIDLGKLIAHHHAKRADLTVALYRRDDPASSGIAALGEDDAILRFAEKPPAGEIFSNWVNAGYLVVEPHVLERIPASTAYDFGRELLPRLVAEGARVFGYRMTEALWWIDTPADYASTQAAFERGAMR
jgi:NDP-sugar pyrophosphorylase family protein